MERERERERERGGGGGGERERERDANARCLRLTDNILDCALDKLIKEMTMSRTRNLWTGYRDGGSLRLGMDELRKTITILNYAFGNVVM